MEKSISDLRKVSLQRANQENKARARTSIPSATFGTRAPSRVTSSAREPSICGGCYHDVPALILQYICDSATACTRNTSNDQNLRTFLA